MTNNNFVQFGLHPNIIKTLNNIGYVTPSPIQKKCIPYLLLRKDVLGIAQTGSGKTAAFILPLLNNLNPIIKTIQILILTPTRELTLQIAKATSDFAKFLHGINVLPLYGGQSYHIQLKGLRLKPQIIVATPGRLLDHINRKNINLSTICSLVLDEADEMLRMGFIEDVENILSTIPKGHQTALFSATMPYRIKNITKKFMNHPYEIKIKSNINTIPNINQSYWIVRGKKIDGLMRFLETENFDAVLVFVKTKNATLEISNILNNFGYNSAPLNGDMNQNIREQTLYNFKYSKLDILIATDIAARGLDVERINLVINYDIPTDAESYTHRIGRTGRAGRTGQALMFVDYREKRLLKNIERIMKVKIIEKQLPNTTLLSQKRLEKFLLKIYEYSTSYDLDQYKQILLTQPFKKFIDKDILSAILLKIAQGNRPLIIPPETYIPKKSHKYNINNKYQKKYKYNMILYSINIGKKDGVEVRHIVGVIINQILINSNDIGNIKLFDYYTTVELLKNNKDLIKDTKNIKILNKKITFKLIKNAKSYLKFHKNIYNK
ncbi:DEAD/DEAH box helicase [Enterobacteriaceae endosymbiont of Neohaemonia nigricornis]|uniref:DEAD/DEAH box helicase n=1 Tax=Enterobacteriaceae endosymbiont of Neohaemonia nigricornis TaxID=2675792 RepID=UPI0014495E52|nr:DEAD/DEAH box helicase [Enterobacteriaceae endosymbiont of Neohaemonia nigricornis]QJC30493.1 DEAD/DEAH box helicase [Enterobacteriaceae endosymbiont of Neohaemonia nigricornis]